MIRGGRCECFLPLSSPEDSAADSSMWWRPERDRDPGPQVRAVARWGEDPEQRRVVRVPGGWVEEGSMVNFYQDRTPPMPWDRTGKCWANRPHAVVEVRADADGWRVLRPFTARHPALVEPRRPEPAVVACEARAVRS